MKTSTVRIGRHAHEILRELSARTGQPAREILRIALEEYRRKLFLEELNRGFAALKRNKRAWREELMERRVWDGALADGLDD